MLDPADLRRHVIRPTLLHLELWSPAAENLVLGTALVESGLTALVQRGGGPALGLYQVEPATHRDLWQNFLPSRRALRDRLAALTALSPEREAQLVSNLAYATAICRIVYLRAQPALPRATDVDGLAGYWKQHYNTRLGKGRPEEFARRYRAAHP